MQNIWTYKRREGWNLGGELSSLPAIDSANINIEKKPSTWASCLEHLCGREDQCEKNCTLFLSVESLNKNRYTRYSRQGATHGLCGFIHNLCTTDYDPRIIYGAPLYIRLYRQPYAPIVSGKNLGAASGKIAACSFSRKCNSEADYLKHLCNFYVLQQRRFSIGRKETYIYNKSVILLYNII